MMRGVVNKLLHLPSTRLKEMENGENGWIYSDALIGLFDLAPESPAEGPPAGEDMDGGSGTDQAEAPSDAGASPNVLRLRIPGKS